MPETNFKVTTRPSKTNPKLKKVQHIQFVEQKITPRKYRIRKAIEEGITDDQPYDIYDIVADLSNAVSDLVQQIPNITVTPAIKKAIQRKIKIDTILAEIGESLDNA